MHQEYWFQAGCHPPQPWFLFWPQPAFYNVFSCIYYPLVHRLGDRWCIGGWGWNIIRVVAFRFDIGLCAGQLSTMSAVFFSFLVISSKCFTQSVNIVSVIFKLQCFGWQCPEEFCCFVGIVNVFGFIWWYDRINTLLPNIKLSRGFVYWVRLDVFGNDIALNTLKLLPCFHSWEVQIFNWK